MIINIEKTLSAFAGDQEIFFSVLEQFTEDFDSQKNKLNSSIEALDFKEIKIGAHTIKGLAATFYFEELKKLALELEEAASNENKEDIKSRHSELLIKFEELYKDAKRILNERT